MKLKETIEKLNNTKFNLDYNFNNYDWTLTIFNDYGDIKFTKNRRTLKEVLELYFNEKIEVKKDLREIENEIIKLELTYTNFEEEENFLTINYDNHFYKDDIEIKNIEQLTTVLTKTYLYIDDFMEEMQENLMPAKAYL